MDSRHQPYRLGKGGIIDRSRSMSFVFDGRTYSGFEGDTLASALLANGVRVFARSFKYHRPRGVFSAGAEEPNALVTVGTGDRAVPNTRATQVWLQPELVATSQNRWPSLRWDVRAAGALLSPMLAAGFYYKTFMRPQRLWPLYERVIRSMAGMGCAPDQPDPDHYDKRYHTCDYLIVGLGPAGLAAALAASRNEQCRVIALDADRLVGGSLLCNGAAVDGGSGVHWARKAEMTLASRPNVTLLMRTTGFGYYDDNLIAAVEQCPASDATGARERVHWIRATQVILATGAHERPVVFPGNDRPGIMLASAARTYLNRYAVAPGKRVAILTNNDSAYDLARDLEDRGITVAALVDMRAQPHRATNAPLRTGHEIAHAAGRSGLRSIEIRPIHDRTGRVETIACDALCVSGGWTPALQLHAHAQGTLQWDEQLDAFVPDRARQSHVSVGACAGALTLNAALSEGWEAGGGIGNPPSSDATNEGLGAREPTARAHAAHLLHERAKDKAFVDLQNDVTVADLALAAREGFDSVEHLKRYTTLGMGTDQGKTSNLNGLGLLAELTQRSVPALGVTTFRPPYSPVTLGALAGHHRGRHFCATRRSAIHEDHVRAGAVFVDAGLWHRPRSYPRDGETLQQSINREVRTVRNGVGMVDVSTLGKIDIQGPDSIELLERVYCNRWRSLEVGKARYGLMLREDGIVLDDGTTSRLGPHHYFMTTSTAHAGKVMSHLEHCLQVLWPDLDVQVTSVTDYWCAIAVAGQHSRAVLERVLARELSNDALPPLGVRTISVQGERALLMRVSFSGERAYEIYVPADLGSSVWNQLLEAGRPYGLAPYGTDALSVLRVEKGHVAGPEIDGRTTAADLGLAKLRSDQKFYIGRPLGERVGLKDPLRPALVGLVPLEPIGPLRAGAQIVSAKADSQSLGHTTTAVFSATLGHSIALALVSGGATRQGEELLALDLLRNERQRVRVVAPTFFDPQGERARG
jgi:methylglutamate dehydrogenase subunit C